MKHYHAFIILLLIVFGLSSCDDATAQLRDHGITTNASIVGKMDQAGTGKRARIYTFELTFFAKDSVSNVASNHANDVLHDTTMSMAERLDHWDPMAGGIGKLTTATLKVSAAQFEQYNPGQSVEIVYLPEDPQVLKLKSEL